MKKLFTLFTFFFFAIMANTSAQTVWVNEDFNSGSLPTGWTRSQAPGSDGWEFGDPATLSSTAFPIPAHTGNIAGANDDACNCNASVDYLISPSFSIPALGAATVKFDVFYGELSYQGITESASVEVTTNGGTTWTSVYSIPGDNSGWKTYFVDISAYAGQTINVGFHYDDNGGWLYGIGVDNVQIYEPVATDAGVTALSISPTQLKSVPISIDGNILNSGATPINAIEVFWSDGTNTQKDSITGLNVASFQTYNFSHSDSLTIATAGNYILKVWTGAINGLVDQNNANDTVDFNLEIVDTLVQRNPLHEVFTSSSCGPCAPGNANLNTIFTPNPEKQVVLKYQMSWPGSGDPYFTGEGNDRRTYYGVNAVPNMFVDGGWDGNTNSYTSSLRDQFYDVPAFMDIQSNIRVECKSVFIDITVLPYKDFPGNNVLHLAVIEKLTYNNVASNGETEFDHVMKKMIPNANGTTIGALTKGVPQTFTLNYTFNGNYTLPPNANSPVNHSSQHTVEEFWDLDVVAFVQNNSSNEVYQSNYSQDMIGYDVALSELNPISNASVGNPVAIGGEIRNWKDSITSNASVHYSINGGTPVNQSMNNLTMNSKGDAATFSFLNTWTPTISGNNVVKVWVDNFNSGSSMDDSPCNDTIEVVVNVTGNSAPLAQFNYSLLGSNTVAFTDASIGATSWSWDFGDGNFSTDQNPTNSYLNVGSYQVCLVASNSTGSDTVCQTVNVISSIATQKESFFNVVPNPSNGIFTIMSDKAINGVITIMDLTGRTILEEEVYGINSKTLNLQEYKKGVYLIRVIEEDKGFTRKLIIE